MIRLTDAQRGAKVEVAGPEVRLGIGTTGVELAQARRAAVTADLVAAALSLEGITVRPTGDEPPTVWVGGLAGPEGSVWVRSAEVEGEYSGLDDATWRLLCLHQHYATPLVVDGERRAQARNAILRVQRARRQLTRESPGGAPAERLSPPAERFAHQIRAALADDLATPEALAVLWQALGHDLDPEQRLAILFEADRLLRLG